MEGAIQAEDRSAVQQQLEKEGLVPIRILEGAGNPGGRGASLFPARVKAAELIVFTRQLGTMLDAGLPILQTLQVLKQQSDNLRLREICGELSERINGGARLSEALAGFPKTFSREYINLVASGESGADLVKALANLADWMEREHEIKTEIKAAVRYPAIVLIALVLLSILLVGFVIPRFALLFTSSGAILPLPTRMLLKGSEWFQRYWVVLAVVAGALVAGGAVLLRRRAVRRKVDEWKFRVPVFGPLYTKIALSRFSRILSMMVRSGVPLLRSLEVAPGVVDNLYLSELVEEARRSIQGGGSIAEGFRKMPILPPMFTSLVAIGERTGSVDDMLEHLVVQYDRDVRYALKTLPATIEPIITVIMGLGVLFLALALFLPIWNMSHAIVR